MTSLAYAKGSTNLLNLNYLYSYDGTNCPSGVTGNNGQIQCVNDVTSTAAAGRSAAYTYDELGRLSSALTTGSAGTGGYAQWGLSFGYDRYGNLLNQQSTAGSVGTTCVSVSTATNQVTGTCAVNPLTSYSYDANGNMLGDGVNSSMTYDAANHLISLYNSSSGGAAYVYDGNGNRVEKCVPSCSGSSPTITVYIFSGSKVIAEYPAGSTGTSFNAEYLYAGGLKVATLVGTTPTYHLRDHLSIRVNTDAGGNIISGGEQGHYPFGELWYPTTAATKEVFTTYERDSESANDYAMARYNVNRLGRFSSIDPLSGNIGNPQSLNRYAYVTNDPMNSKDPSGMDAIATGTQPGNCTLDGITADCGWVGHLCATVGECGSGGGGGGGGNGGGGAAGLPNSPSQNFISEFPTFEGLPICDPGLDCDPFNMDFLSSLIPTPSQPTTDVNGGGGGGPCAVLGGRACIQPPKPPTTKDCDGQARVLAGNPSLIGKIGGLGIPVPTNTAAVFASQVGGSNAALRIAASQISGAAYTASGTFYFTAIGDTIGTTSTSGSSNLNAWRQDGVLVLELNNMPPSADNGGAVGVSFTVPINFPCPTGTNGTGVVH